MRVAAPPPVESGAPASEAAARARPAPGLVATAVTLYFILFLLVFPKGGVAVSGVPLTWGYLGLAAFAAYIPVWLFTSRQYVSGARLLAVLALVPFQLVVWTALLTQGAENLGTTVALAATFFAVPLVFLLPVGAFLDRTDCTLIAKGIRYGMVAIAAYGIVLFVVRWTTGSFIEVPLLTINLGDMGALEDKYIDRGGVFKLISTYNNGNLYGIAILILLPLYEVLERRRLPRWIVKGSLVLTLSRTVWVGLIAYEFLSRVYVRRISLRSIAMLGGAVVVLVAGIASALHLLDADMAFLLDATLGGRSDQWANLHQTGVLGRAPVEFLEEMVYLSVLRELGIAGLATFLLALSAPLFLYRARRISSPRPIQRALIAGLTLYLFVAIVDGAILLIPVMAFYWFVASLLLDPGTGGVRAGSPGPASSDRRSVPIAPEHALR